MFSARANISSTARLALLAAGGAAARTPSASPYQPAISDRVALGCALTCKRAVTGQIINQVIMGLV